MKKNSWIRTIYLYAFALLGLVLLVISGVRFLDMGLKAFVFTKADEEQRARYAMPPMPYQLDKVEALRESGQLSLEENLNIDQFLADYNSWKERTKKVNPITAQRQRTASSSLAMILVGLPLYLYHWSVIKKED